MKKGKLTVKALLQSDDQFFMNGIQLIMKNFYSPFLNGTITEYCTTLCKENVESADIIILSCPPGTIFLCSPLLRYRKKNSILFIITDVKSKANDFFLPLCFQQAFIIDKTISSLKFTSLLFDALSRPYINNYTTCQKCKNKNMTLLQHSVGEGLFCGMTIPSIAETLNISSKTAYSHKNAIKHKFSLHSNHELFLFLSYLYKDRSPSEMLLNRFVRD